MINNLEKKGYVKRKKNLSDQRIKHVYLTTRGQEIIALHQDFEEHIVEELFQENLFVTEESIRLLYILKNRL